VTPGALFKFNRVPLHELKHLPETQWKNDGGGAKGALTTRSLLRTISALRAEKRRIDEAIAVLEGLAMSRSMDMAEGDRKGPRLVGK
jgi:hypothetical protein